MSAEMKSLTAGPPRRLPVGANAQSPTLQESLSDSKRFDTFTYVTRAFKHLSSKMARRPNSSRLRKVDLQLPRPFQRTVSTSNELFLPTEAPGRCSTTFQPRSRLVARHWISQPRLRGRKTGEGPLVTLPYVMVRFASFVGRSNGGGRGSP